jgi:hypothetical protein
MTTQAQRRAPSSSPEPTITINKAAFEAMVEELRDLRSISHVLGAFVGMLSRPRPRPVDVNAERRILGGLAIGRVTLADVAELRAPDFSSPERRALFATCVTHLGGPRSLVTMMQESDAAADMSLEERAGHVRTWLVRWAPMLAAQTFNLTEAALVAELAACPRPGCVPRREIENVAAMGRGWHGPVAAADRRAK